MDLIKDFLISTFFEGALAILWVGTLVIAWRRPGEFGTEPLNTAVTEVESLWSKVKGSSHISYMVVLLVICFFLIGTVMQRISDEFVETTSRWMPKPSTLTYKQITYKQIGTDRDIKEEIMRNYRHFLAKDDELLKFNESWCEVRSKKAMDKVIRDSRTRRAFGGKDSASYSYMNRLLELVRICQALLMHSFLLSFILFSLAVVIWINKLDWFRSRPQARSFAFRGWIIALFAWTFGLAPKLHDLEEYNYPVMLVFLVIIAPLFVIGKKILSEERKREENGQQRDKRFRGVYQLVTAALVVLIFCYWSTFSWAEHRANYEEAALVLGGESSAATPVVTSPASCTVAVITQVAELSGSAVFQDGLLIADDELIGMVLHVPEPSDKQLCSKLLKIERKGKESHPITNNPKLAAVQDIEGIASDGNADIFFIGSHNPKEGYRRTDREFLIHARWEEGKLRWFDEYRNLAGDLEAPLKKIGVSLNLTRETINSKFNVEGLAWHERKLYIGLRGPLAPDGRAIIAFTNAMRPFQKTPDVKFDVRLVPLNGAGIRSLDWDPKTEKMLILSGPTGEEQTPRPALWIYDIASEKLEPVHIFTDKELKRSDKSGGRFPEGVSRWNDKIVIVFDNENKDLPAELLYLNWP